jgi:23S rRNA (adenine2030-N6)-methyltransferase
VHRAWHPIKDPRQTERFHADLVRHAWPELLANRASRSQSRSHRRLNGCSRIVANPPYRPGPRLTTVLPELSRRLAIGPGAGYRVDRLVHRSAASQQRSMRAGAALKR